MKTIMVSQSLVGYVLTFVLVVAGTLFINDFTFAQSSIVNKSSVVGIFNKSDFVGTGFVTENGIYTAKHVALNSDSLFISFSKNSYQLVCAKKLNDSLDIAILSCDSIPKDVVKLKISKKELKVFDEVYSLGHPDGFPYVYYKGYVQKVTRGKYYLSFDITGGMSGAPLIGSDGMVYGIITGYTRNFSTCVAIKFD